MCAVPVLLKLECSSVLESCFGFGHRRFEIRVRWLFRDQRSSPAVCPLHSSAPSPVRVCMAPRMSPLLVFPPRSVSLPASLVQFIRLSLSCLSSFARVSQSPPSGYLHILCQVHYNIHVVRMSSRIPFSHRCLEENLRCRLQPAMCLPLPVASKRVLRGIDCISKARYQLPRSSHPRLHSSPFLCVGPSVQHCRFVSIQACVILWYRWCFVERCAAVLCIPLASETQLHPASVTRPHVVSLRFEPTAQLAHRASPVGPSTATRDGFALPLVALVRACGERCWLACSVGLHGRFPWCVWVQAVPMLLLFHLSPQCCTHCSSLARAVLCLVVSWLRQPGWICVSFHVRTPCVCSTVWHKPWCILWFSIPCSELPRGMLLLLENRDAALFAWHEPLARIAVFLSLRCSSRRVLPIVQSAGRRSQCPWLRWRSVQAGWLSPP